MKRKNEKVCHVDEPTFNINSGVKFKSTLKGMASGNMGVTEASFKAAQTMTLNFGCLIDKIPLCFKMRIYMTGDKRQEGSLLVLCPLKLSKDRRAGTL